MDGYSFGLWCGRQNRFARPSPHSTNFFEKADEMAEGTIKRLTDKGFGFIDTGDGSDIFFHLSALDGVTFEELSEGQRVSYTAGQGPKGPRAENVRPA